MYLILYNKLTKKNKNLSTEGGERKDNRLHWITTGDPIFGNSVNSQISKFKYTQIAVNFIRAECFF